MDTIAPKLEIISPQYTTREMQNTITIQANEEVSSYQEIYIIDSNNNRHDYTFSKVGEDKYVGYLNFYDYPIGIVTIYARLKDTVDNISNLFSKTMEIKDSIPFIHLKINDRVASLDIKQDISKVTISDKKARLDISDSDKWKDGAF